jgi:hypothetical protein
MACTCCRGSVCALQQQSRYKITACLQQNKYPWPLLAPDYLFLPGLSGNGPCVYKMAFAVPSPGIPCMRLHRECIERA